MKHTFKDGDTIIIENGDAISNEERPYVIAALKDGGYALLDASSAGWMPADFEE